MTSKRSIGATNETAYLQPVIKIVVFARLDFLSGVRRFHTEIGPKNATHPIHGSELYLGIGDFGGLSTAIVESVSSAPRKLGLTITGVKSSLINTALTDDYFRRDAEIMIGLEDENGELVADPEILYSGFMDKVDIVLNKGIGQMTLVCESRGTNMLKASDLRFNDEDKQAEVTGDLLAEYVWRMTDITLKWGDKAFLSPLGPPGHRGGRVPNHRGRRRT